MEEKLELQGEPTGVDTERFLREEIALLKNENEALRKELKEKELILQSVKHVETLTPKLPRSTWSDDDEDLVSPTIPTYSKEVKFRYPQRKHTGKAKNVASLSSNDVGFIHMSRFGAIGDDELDFPALSVGDMVGPNGALFSISKQPNDRPATIRGKQSVIRNLEQFYFDLRHVVALAASLPPTKRSVLKIAAKIFDPLGCRSFIINMKTLIQELCAT